MGLKAWGRILVVGKSGKKEKCPASRRKEAPGSEGELLKVWRLESRKSAQMAWACNMADDEAFAARTENIIPRKGGTEQWQQSKKVCCGTCHWV
jgi:hypothetical protein